MSYASRTKDAQGSPASLVREAFARAGRDDPALLMRCLAEARATTRKGVAPVRTATDAIEGVGLRIGRTEGPIEILPSGRDGALIAQLDAFDVEEGELRARVHALVERRRTAISDVVVRRLAEQGRAHPDRLSFSASHDCDGSPSGFCCYDPQEDPALDVCLFCGQPDERK